MESAIDSPDYGIDAPGIVRNFALAGAAAVLAGLVVPSISVLGRRIPWGSVLAAWGVTAIAMSGAMVLYARLGKFRHRDRLLGAIRWRGDERVLDVGTGRGLLAIGAAKKLRSGQAVGIDIWNKEDLSGNNAQSTLRNAELEGVRGKLEIRSEDARNMSFDDETFDVVVSNLCLHNIYDPIGRREACEEIARVLKPGGIALISDFRHTGEYEKTLRIAGLKVSRSKPFFTDTFPPLRIVRAEKNV